VLSYQDSNLE